MMGALSARPRPAGFAAIAAAATGATLLLASSAAAAMPARGSAAMAARSTGAAPVTAGRHLDGRSLRTLFDTVRVFTSANTRSGIKGKLSRRGIAVSVICWTTGTYYKDVPIWYEVSAPLAGYMSAFNLAAHFSPAFGVPHCLAPAFREQFNALEANLRIRAAPSTTASISGYLASVGSKVIIDCYATGSAIFKDPIWYHAVSPSTGYVSGRLLNTGGDPAPGVPHC